MNRRKILKTIASGAGIGAAGIGNVQAEQSRTEIDPEKRQAKIAQYTDADSVRQAIAAHGTDLIQQLVARGYLDTDNLMSLDLTERREKNMGALRPQSDISGYGVVAYDENGTLVTHIMISQSTDQCNYSLYVRPEEERAYAVVDAADEEGMVMINPSPTRSQVSSPEPEACAYGIICDSEYDCGSVCSSLCAPLDPSYCDRYAQNKVSYKQDSDGPCDCTEITTVECGCIRDNNGSALHCCVETCDYASTCSCC